MTLTQIIITVVVALISLFLGGAITRYYSSRRNLALVVPSLFDVIDLRRVAKEKIQILYNQKNIQSLWVVRFLVQNRGNADIQKSMVRRCPYVSFGDKAVAIDVEPVSLPEDAIVNATIGETGTVSFSIEYLKRHSQAAFQILVHSETEAWLSAGDIVADTGLIENTKVDFVNLMSGGFPHFMDRTSEIVRLHRKVIIGIYMFLSIGFILFGVFALVQPFFSRYFPVLKSTCQPASRAVGILLNGCFLLLPTWYIWRKFRYLAVFYNKSKLSKDKAGPATESKED